MFKMLNPSDSLKSLLHPDDWLESCNDWATLKAFYVQMDSLFPFEQYAYVRMFKAQNPSSRIRTPSEAHQIPQCDITC
jgi:hypothetical protein